jgi:hypothetical protein
MRPSGLHFFGIQNNNFLTEQGHQSALQPTPNLEDHDPAFTSPSDMVVQLYTQAPGYLLVIFTNSQEVRRTAQVNI